MSVRVRSPGSAKYGGGLIASVAAGLEKKVDATMIIKSVTDLLLS